MCVFKRKESKTCQASAQEKKDQIIMEMSGKYELKKKKKCLSKKIKVIENNKNSNSP